MPTKDDQLALLRPPGWSERLGGRPGGGDDPAVPGGLREDGQTWLGLGRGERAAVAGRRHDLSGQGGLDFRQVAPVALLPGEVGQRALGRADQHGDATVRIDQAEHLARKERDLAEAAADVVWICLLYTSPSPRDGLLSRMPSSA